jgi:hypothetical protein
MAVLLKEADVLLFCEVERILIRILVIIVVLVLLVLCIDYVPITGRRTR